jgi:ATP-dependent DNA helicase RecQ
LVLHYQIPSSVESYYQEAGRAGRDGKSSRCILFFQNGDLAVQSFIIRKESNRKGGETLLEAIRAYAYSTVCRQKFLCDYFGEEIESCKVCDVCNLNGNGDRHIYLEELEEKKQKKIDKSKYEFTANELQILKELLIYYPGVFGKKILVGILRGSKSKAILRMKVDKSPFYGNLSKIAEEALLAKLDELISSKEIRIAGQKFPKLYLFTHPPVSKKEKIEADIKSGLRVRKIPTPTPSQALVKALKNYRDREARKYRWKKFMVLHNAVITRIANLKPETKQDLIHIKGLGEAKIEKFGEGILETIRKHG